MSLKGKKILLGITGSIAAYKAAVLTRLLVKAGAEVKVLMTDDAKTFIQALTLSTLSSHPVYHSFTNENNDQWNEHVALGLWADLMLVAPATANSISKFANGICDNMLTAVYLSCRCKVYIAPAMDVDMYKHPSTKTNIDKLKSYGNIFLGPDDGELASGLSGMGRMKEPEEILEILKKDLNSGTELKGKKVLVSAGPTVEPIDPVRYISNHSSGKMGFALANEMASRGARVTLVAGPGVDIDLSESVKLVRITTAKEMHEACMKHFKSADIVVMAAAVADFTPVSQSREKIKKNSDLQTIKLKPTVDILAEMGKSKSVNQILVGFALETNNEKVNAEGKLKKKNLDIIVLNSLNDQGAGFKTDTNKITILDKKNGVVEYPLKSKQLVAIDIVDKIVADIEK